MAFQQGRWAIAHVVGKKQDWDDFLLFLIHHSAGMTDILFLGSWSVKASGRVASHPSAAPLLPGSASDDPSPVRGSWIHPTPGTTASPFALHHPIHSSEPQFAHRLMKLVKN